MALNCTSYGPCVFPPSLGRKRAAEVGYCSGAEAVTCYSDDDCACRCWPEGAPKPLKCEIMIMTPEPTPAPTEEPTLEPTPAPALEPTPAPTEEPSPEPTPEPTTPAPTPEPTFFECPPRSECYVLGGECSPLEVECPPAHRSVVGPCEEAEGAEPCCHCCVPCAALECPGAPEMPCGMSVGPCVDVENEPEGEPAEQVCALAPELPCFGRPEDCECFCTPWTAALTPPAPPSACAARVCDRGTAAQVIVQNCTTDENQTCTCIVTADGGETNETLSCIDAPTPAPTPAPTTLVACEPKFPPPCSSCTAPACACTRACGLDGGCECFVFDEQAVRQGPCWAYTNLEALPEGWTLGCGCAVEYACCRTGVSPDAACTLETPYACAAAGGTSLTGVLECTLDVCPEHSCVHDCDCRRYIEPPDLCRVDTCREGVCVEDRLIDCPHACVP